LRFAANPQQVEEALKRFQTALKLHAQGPRSFDEAADAYEDLFKSEIFLYPEAATDFDRAELQTDPVTTETPYLPPHDLSQADGDGSGIGLPQALYLAYKNRGQFRLDRLRYQSRTASVPAEDFFAQQEVLGEAQKALSDFGAALDRDPADAELWRRTSRVAAFLGSSRTSRYCLEAAIELDDDPTVEEVEPPSLAEALAGQELKDQLEILSDDISLSHPIMAPWIKQGISSVIQRRLDPLPFLPNPTKALAIHKAVAAEVVSTRVVMNVPSLSWAELGIAMLHFLAEHGLSGRAIFIELPDPTDDEDTNMVDNGHNNAESIQDEREEIERQLASEAARAESQQKEIAVTDDKGNGDQATTDTARPERTMLTRKRSQSAAGMPEGGGDENGAEKRSKRIRRRETAQEELLDPSALAAAQLQQCHAADQYLFQTTKNILENLGVRDQETLGRLSETLDSFASEDRGVNSATGAAADLRHTISSFSEENAKILLNKKDQPTLGRTSFLEHAKTGPQKASQTPLFDDAVGVRAFARKTNASWVTIQDLAFDWLVAIVESYPRFKWPDAMKYAVVQVISRLDQDIYQRARDEVNRCGINEESELYGSSLHNLAQMLFELHLDIYERITNPNSIVEYGVRVETQGRLVRWLDFASEICRSRPTCGSVDNLSVRFLWSAIASTTLAKGASRDHILQCWTGLRECLADVADGLLPINLPNNAFIPEISAASADREISKLTTMDFFLSLFQEDSDPVVTIENLEPVLNPGSVYASNTDDTIAAADVSTPSNSNDVKAPITETAGQVLQDLWRFLAGSGMELRLFLWSRLGEAYAAIGYVTKQFSCHLKSIEMLVSDLESDAYLKEPPETRAPVFMKVLKALDEQIIKALDLALNEGSAFDIIDDQHIQSTSSSLAKLSCLLHNSTVYEDEVRVGITQPPSNGVTFGTLLSKLREIQVRTWSLQYTVVKAGISINRDMFPSPEPDLAGFLHAIHGVLGLRKFCKASNKIFLKMMRMELLKMKNLESWEDYAAQVLYDLHGLKGFGVEEVQDHGVVSEKLEKKNAVQLVERVTALASGVPMKDLVKSDLKTTIEHMQQTIGQPRTTAQMMYNYKNFAEYIKRPIHPLRLFLALKGRVTLDAVVVNTAEGALAQHGWFFLLGMIALTKFKAVDLNRRQTPGATDDLRIGATFMRLQLQFTPDKWDAWLRMAECFDCDIDEAVLWNSDKMNKDRNELVKLQRSAIHCYTLALSNSFDADVDTEDGDPLYELYHGFAMRLYASSREPFAMEPFHHPNQERFFIQNFGTGTYQKKIHDEMSDYKVWKFAASLFRRAAERKPADWR
jgi:tetratricopeptide (TPR) repeat protein